MTYIPTETLDVLTILSKRRSALHNFFFLFYNEFNVDHCPAAIAA